MNNEKESFLKRKNVIISFKRYGIDAMGSMALGLFASLLIGTIIIQSDRMCVREVLCQKSCWRLAVMRPV